jgi:sialate O-acetylesterase
MRTGHVVLTFALSASATCVGAAAPTAALTIDLPVSDNAVLQRDRPLTIGGAAAPGERIDLRLGSIVANGKADARGRWRVTLPSQSAGGDFNMNVSAGVNRSIRVRGLTFGDVWLCSGQSNMELPVKSALNADQEIASSFIANLRLLIIPHDAKPVEQARFASPVAWTPASPASVAGFSAACYFMARDLQERLNIPIGLIQSSWGGSNIEGWISGDALSKIDGHAAAIALNALYARDADAAQRQMADHWQAWWHTAAGATSSPWQAESVLAWQAAPTPLRNWKAWGVAALSDYNGMVWFDQRFDLTPTQALQAATLDLGAIDEVDQSWVNGKPVGNSFGWATERSYRMSAGTLRAGANRVVLNIYSAWGLGGLFGPADKIVLRLADGTRVPLGNGWRYALPKTPVGAPPPAPWHAIGGQTGLFNAMIAPIGSFPVKGVAWYQGESNTGNAAEYAALLDALKSSWRSRFGARTPFLIVQLPGFGAAVTNPVTSGWASVREGQRRSTERDPQSALVVTIDLGDASELHPPNKQAVGFRLARAARSLAYGEAITQSGPKIATVMRRNDAVAIRFKDVTGGLVTRSAASPIAFELCGDIDSTCRFADARLENDVVMLTGPDALNATRVRYCWGDAPLCNLYDRAELPVGPFENAIGR